MTSAAIQTVYSETLPSGKTAYFFRLQHQQAQLFAPYAMHYETSIFIDKSVINELPFGKIYLSLEALFGRPFTPSDPYKMSFSFPLLVKIIDKEDKNEKTLIMDIRDYKGTIETEYWLLPTLDDYQPHINNRSSDINASEEEKKDIESLEQRIFHRIRNQKVVGYPFLNTVESCFFIYGWGNGDFFEHWLDSPIEFENKIKTLKDSNDMGFVGLKSAHQFIDLHIQSSLEPKRY